MSYWPNTPIYSHVLRALYSTAAEIAVTIISPANGSTLTSGEVNVTWTFSPGSQQTYRVRAFAPDGVTVEYDSGVITSASSSHTIPEGFLESGVTGYIIQVDITTTTAGSGTGSVVVDTAFVPSSNVENVRVRPTGDACDIANPDIPRNVIQWDQVVPDGSETFIRYSVWRREATPYSPITTASWVRIASIEDISTLRYVDYNPQSYTTYQYDVTWTAVDINDDYLTSQRRDTAPTARLEFDWSFIHDVLDPTRWFAFYFLDNDEEIVSDREVVAVWGRQPPSVFIGDLEYRQYSITGLPAVYRGDLWPSLFAQFQRQRTAASTVMFRHGVAGTRMFASITGLSRSNGQAQFEPSVELTETYYPEQVA